MGTCTAQCLTWEICGPAPPLCAQSWMSPKWGRPHGLRNLLPLPNASRGQASQPVGAHPSPSLLPPTPGGGDAVRDEHPAVPVPCWEALGGCWLHPAGRQCSPPPQALGPMKPWLRAPKGWPRVGEAKNVPSFRGKLQMLFFFFFLFLLKGLVVCFPRQRLAVCAGEGGRCWSEDIFTRAQRSQHAVRPPRAPADPEQRAARGGRPVPGPCPQGGKPFPRAPQERAAPRDAPGCRLCPAAARPHPGGAGFQQQGWAPRPVRSPAAPLQRPGQQRTARGPPCAGWMRSPAAGLPRRQTGQLVRRVFCFQCSPAAAVPQFPLSLVQHVGAELCKGQCTRCCSWTSHLRDLGLSPGMLHTCTSTRAPRKFCTTSAPRLMEKSWSPLG